MYLPGSVVIMCPYAPKRFLSPLQVHGAASCHLCSCEKHFKYDTLAWQYTPWAVTSPAERWHHRLQWRTSEACPHILRAFMSKKQNIQRFPQHGAWAASLGSFISSQDLYVKFGMETKGMLRLAWVACVQYFYSSSSGESPSWSLSQLVPSSILAVWQIFDKFLEYFLSFACADIQPNTSLPLHICRSGYSECGDEGDKRNNPQHPLYSKNYFHSSPQALIKNLWRDSIPVA